MGAIVSTAATVDEDFDELFATTSKSSSSATTASPKLIHDGESYRIYKAVVPALSTLPTSADNTSSLKEESQQQIQVAIKTRQPSNDYLSNLNNEYNILKLDKMANCPSVRKALKKDKSFQVPSQEADENGSGGGTTATNVTTNATATNAIYLEWVEGITLTNWLKLKKGATTQDDDNNYYYSLTNASSDLKGESARLLAKVRIASKLAEAVANIHDAGIVHNELNGDNVILSLDRKTTDHKKQEEATSEDDSLSFRVTIIDFEYADQCCRLEATDEGDRVNDDIPHLATLLREIFALQEGEEEEEEEDINEYGIFAGGNGAKSNSLLPGNPFSPRLNFGNTHGEFSKTFQNAVAAGSIAQSNYDANDDDKTSVGSTTDRGSSTSHAGDDDHHHQRRGESNHIFGVISRISFGSARTTLSDIREVLEDHDVVLPRNLPRSVMRVLADIQDAGHDTRETAYSNAREVAEDLHQMAYVDPTVFLADPTRADTAKSAFRRPPRRLYGREKELAALRSAMGRLMDVGNGGIGNDDGVGNVGTCGRRTEVVLIAGRSGTGKSSLLRQARSDSKGVFVMGKFDQLQSMQPYSALISAFDQVVHSILAEDETVVAEIKKDILKAVGANGKVLTDVIPSLVKVIGEQPEVANATGIEAQNRFRYIAQCFARAICTPRRPLICVLDDLQWCDTASIDLMRTLVTDQSNKYLLFIGCYRDDEMGADHHVSVQFDQMKKGNNVKFTTIELGNMDLDSLTSFVSERLRLPRRLTKSISEIVHRKSLGNAFFATTFLQSLVDGGLLTFSPTKMRWIWDEAEADARNISDDVVEVMAERIQTLRLGAQDVLKIASCIGATFETSIIKNIMTEEASNEASLDRYLNALAKQGLIIKMIRRDANHDVVQYKFSHDRIQQAAYSLLPKSEKEAMHLRIGRMLKKELSDTAPTSLVFKTVDQLNRGAGCMTDRHEQIELAMLNARAAEEAYNACAFTPSTTYAQESLAILGNGDTAWKDHYTLVLTLNNLLAELKFCQGNFNESMEITQCIFKRAKTFDDQFIAQKCNVKSMMLDGDFDGALTTSLRILRVLGEPLPKKPSTSAAVAGLIMTKKAIRKKSNEYISSLPPMAEERVVKCMEILNVLASVTYLSGSDYFAIVNFKTIRLMLKYGQTACSPFAISVYGFLVYAILKDIKQADRFGQLGVSLSFKATISRSSFIVYTFITHWRYNVVLTLDPLIASYHEGLASGDIEYAGYSALVYNVHGFHSGQVGIQSVIQGQKLCMQELTKAAKSSVSDLLRPVQQAAINLTGQSQDPVVLTGEVMDEEELLQRSAETANVLLDYYIRMNVACVSYIFGDYDRASVQSLKIQDIADKFPALYAINVQAFYDGLSAYALARTTNSRTKWIKRGRNMRKKFINWARDCPSNNTHKILLLKAEDASLFALKSKKKREIAEQAYNAAILGATDSGFVNAAAIASERAAEFYNSIGKHEQFASHIVQAYQLYSKWGADGKCEWIAKKYPEIVHKSQY